MNLVIKIISDYWTLILSLIFGVIISRYFYLKGQKKRIPTYMVRTINLIRGNIQKIGVVDILYSKEKIDNLSVSKIALWNDGKETINSTDIAQKEPIRLVINENYIFLDVKILFQKNNANDFIAKISDDKKSINILFDYFEFEEGIVIQTFHTGSSSYDITVEGKVKSVKEIYRKDIYPSLNIFSMHRNNKPHRETKSRQFLYKRNFYSYFILISGIAMMIFGLIDFLFRNDSDLSFMTIIPIDKSKDLTSILAMALGILYIYVGYIYSRRRIPKSFNVFNESFLNQESTISSSSMSKTKS